MRTSFGTSEIVLIVIIVGVLILIPLVILRMRRGSDNK